jgi:hypothetical protein
MDSAAQCGIKKGVACKINIASRNRDVNPSARRLFLIMAGFSLTTPFYLNKLGMTVEISRFGFNRK